MTRTPQIPIEELAGLPDILSPEVSPDGQLLASGVNQVSGDYKDRWMSCWDQGKD